MRDHALRVGVRVLVAVLSFTATVAAQPAGRDSTDQGLAELAALTGSEIRHSLSPRSGAVAFLGTSPGSPIPLRAAGDAPSRARAFLDSQAALFALDGAGDLVTETATPADAVGTERVRFRQMVADVPVTGGEVTVQLRGTGVVAVLNRTVPGVGSMTTRPVLQAQAASERAIAAVRGRGPEVEGLTYTRPRLEILDRAHLGGPPAPVRLAWFVEARAPDRREYVWIDATGGATLLHFSQFPHARNRQVWDANDPGDGVFGDLPGLLVREEGDGPTGDTDTNDAYDFAGDTYDYFSSDHGRDSYDDAGATLHSTVHYCPDSGHCPYVNAFWNGAQMVYGDGFPAADDVVAHELTHAVTEHSANLFYYMQSGALNESFSDIFGEVVDLENGAGNDAASVRWRMGEDVPGIGAIRDMMTPTDFNDPGKTSDGLYVCGDPGSDRGGVHSNSGVPNHAFALMVDGGTYNGVAVTGIGLDKAGRVQYRALTGYLLSSSGFHDAADVLAQSCLDLIGTAGITAGDCDSVEAAIAAVELDEDPGCAPVASPPLCGLGQVAQDLYYEDFEELAGDSTALGSLSDWTQQVLSSDGHWDVFPLGPFATSGSGHLFGYNLPHTADSALAMTTDVSIPADGALLQFQHSFGFENSGATYYDGGVLEYSLDGGASWSDAGSLISAGAGYVGTLSAGNPLGGRSAFTGDSFGYTGSQLTLADFAAQNVRFRFRIGTDSILDDYGWFVDDFRVYTCEADGGCTPDLVLELITVTTTVAHEACDSITAGNDYVVASTGDVTLTAPTVVFESGFRVQSGGQLRVVNN